MKDDRGELDLTKQIDNLKQEVEGYKVLIKMQREELWNLRLAASELEKSKNLLQGYKKVIEQLSNKLKLKDS
tara:strand:+ start:66 stop:281 length:216 start_codon:yes stop_codon:yes gene_type:complete